MRTDHFREQSAFSAYVTIRDSGNDLGSSSSLDAPEWEPKGVPQSSRRLPPSSSARPCLLSRPGLWIPPRSHFLGPRPRTDLEVLRGFYRPPLSRSACASAVAPAGRRSAPAGFLAGVAGIGLRMRRALTDLTRSRGTPPPRRCVAGAKGGATTRTRVRGDLSQTRAGTAPGIERGVEGGERPVRAGQSFRHSWRRSSPARPGFRRRRGNRTPFTVVYRPILTSRQLPRRGRGLGGRWWGIVGGV